MRIAIVGAGVSGLVIAHLLHGRARRSRCSRPATTPAATRTRFASTLPNETHQVDTGFIVFNDRNYPYFQRLLDAPGVPSQPSSMSSRHRRTRRLRIQRAVRRTGCSPSARTSRRRHSTGWSPTWCASTVRSRTAAGSRRAQPVARPLARGAQVLADVHRAADRSPGSRGVVSRPAPDVELPRAVRRGVLRQPRDARISGPPAAGGRSRAARHRYVRH